MDTNLNAVLMKKFTVENIFFLMYRYQYQISKKYSLYRPPDTSIDNFTEELVKSRDLCMW